MQKHPVRLYWLIGALLTVALFFMISRVSNFRFENSDDGLILRSFMGFEGGTPANFSLYIHTLLAWALCGLGLFAPAVPWFSLFQLALLFLSATVMMKSMMQLAKGYRRPWLAGGLAGGVYLAVFAAFACCRVNYTTTAALAGAAATAQFLTADIGSDETGRTVRASILSLLLLVCAYCLRAMSALPSMAFIALILLWRLAGIQNAANPAKKLRSLLVTLAVFALTFGALIGVRQAEISARNLQPELDWHEARTALMDYTAFESDPAPALACQSGLAPAEVEMVRQWYFLDSNITVKALRRMEEAYASAQKESAGARLSAFFSSNPRYGYTAGLLLILCALCWVGKRKTEPLAAFAATLALLGALALLLILSWRGRLPTRAADAVLMPCAALLGGLALKKHACRAGGVRRAAALTLAVALFVTAALDTKLVYHAITRAPDTVSMQREAELEAYALQNPTLLVVRSPNLLRDTRLMPDTSKGVAKNVTLWGDWTCRTPGWYAQLETLGFAGRDFTAADWLRDTIVFAAASSQDTADLCAYLTEALNAPVEATRCGTQGTLEFYQFRKAE